MSLISPVPEANAPEKAAQTYGRLREMFGTDTVPTPFLTMGRVPAFLADYYMNFKKFVFTAGKLSEAEKAMIALAVAVQLDNATWSAYFAERVERLAGGSVEAAAGGGKPGGDQIDGKQLVADIVAVTATCGMYNTLFKFRDIAGGVFEGMSVGLRAHTFHGTLLTDRQVELINIAISDLNACKPCVTGHVDKARKLGLADEAIFEVIQCAATVAAAARFDNAA